MASPSRGGLGPQRKSAGKFCRLCYAAGKDKSVYESHYIARCDQLTDRDKQDFISTLAVIATREDDEENDQEEEEECDESSE